MALDITVIKTAIKTILDAANVSGATYDLSTGLTTRVKRVLTRGMNTQMFNADVIPCVAIFTDRKKVDMKGMSNNQLQAKRQAIASFQIAAVVWNSNFSTIDKDPADDDIEKLMENIEEVLRRNDTLNGNVLWQHPVNVTYHDLPRSEQEHYRVGIMDVEICKFY